MSPCNCDKNKINLSLIDDVLDEYAAVPGSLITILQKAQDIYGYLPTDVIKYISDKTGIKPAKIMGVATFYTQFRLKPSAYTTVKQPTTVCFRLKMLRASAAAVFLRL